MLNNVKLKLSDLKLSIQLICTLLIAVLFSNFFSDSLQSTFYAISITLKNLLLFILPAVIFSCVFSCLLALRGGKAIGLMLGLFALVCISNYFSTMIAYGIGTLDLVNIASFSSATETLAQTNQLIPLWSFEFPSWISNDQALYLGFSLGALFSFFPTPWADRFSMQSKRLVMLFLEKGFVPILPLFAFGFILKMQHDGVLNHIIQSYLPLILVILITYVLHLGLLFAIAANFNLSCWLRYLKNVFPVGLVAFSTMSSMATMPVTLKAAEKNTDYSDIVEIVIPATVNVHMVGVAIAIPLMAFSILSGFGYELPSFSTYCNFALYFILAQFAVAAIPGGAILVLLPILETHLGFSGEMSALMTAMYILFDPLVTVTNVLGNSALAILIAKAFARFKATTSNSDSDSDTDADRGIQEIGKRE
jgi:Na+/H+-dicarboxylate symporter